MPMKFVGLFTGIKYGTILRWYMNLKQQNNLNPTDSCMFKITTTLILLFTGLMKR